MILILSPNKLPIASAIDNLPRNSPILGARTIPTIKIAKKSPNTATHI